jgi:hypothetical protein
MKGERVEFERAWKYLWGLGQSPEVTVLVDEAYKRIQIATTDLSLIDREELAPLQGVSILEHDGGIHIEGPAVSRTPPASWPTVGALSKRRLKSLCLPAANRPGKNKVAHARVPQMAEQLAILFLPKHLRESLLGDLEEEFQTIILPKFGVRFASRWYWLQVLRSVYPIVGVALLKLGLIAWLGKAASWLVNKLST